MADVAAAKGSVSLSGIEETLNDYLGKRAPQLPPNVKEVIVKIAPWLAILGVILAIPPILFLFGFSGLVAITYPLDGLNGVRSGTLFFVGIAFVIAFTVLAAMAIPGLFARSMKAWRLIYFTVLLNTLSQLLTINIVGAALSLVIGGYFLFQVRPLYK